jgi:FkbM family methyltransferase
MLRPMRRALRGWADAVGVRKAVGHGRDRLVDVLNGDNRGSGERRNSQDDRNLKLLILFMLQTNSNCLDIGASRGKFLRVMERAAPQGTHIAYEPVPSLSQDLARRFPSFDVRQRALSNEEGEARFVHVLDPGFQGYSRLEEFQSEVTYPDDLRTELVTVTTERLDNHLLEGWLPDFVKMDVEGAERLVLDGAMDTLRRAQPILAFEHGWHGDESAEIHRMVTKEIGLRIFDMDGVGPLDQSQFMDKLGSRWNWLARR